MCVVYYGMLLGMYVGISLS